MNKIINSQKILDVIMTDGELARDFMNSILNISIKSKDKIYYTEYKNLYNINNYIYIHFNISNDKNISGIYDGIRYYYKYSFKNNNKFNFFYISFNNFGIISDNDGDIILQIKDRNTKKVLIDNFNIICLSLPRYKKLYDSFKRNRKVLWLCLINCNDIKFMDKLCSYLMDNDKKEEFIKEIVA